MQEVEALSLIMTMSLCAHDIPFSGSAGGVRLDPTHFSKAELERITRRYTLELMKKNFIGPSTDVVAPELGTDRQIMTWMKDTYSSINGQTDINAEAIATGKYKSEGGVKGHLEAPGIGVGMSIRELLNNDEFVNHVGTDKGIAGKTFAVQGFGKTGHHLSRFVHENGGIIKVVIEKDSAIYKESGFDPDSLQRWF